MKIELDSSVGVLILIGVLALLYFRWKKQQLLMRDNQDTQDALVQELIKRRTMREQGMSDSVAFSLGSYLPGLESIPISRN